MKTANGANAFGVMNSGQDPEMCDACPTGVIRAGNESIPVALQPGT